MTPKKFGLKYVQKLAKRSTCAYVVPDEVGILLNSLKRMLDILRPWIESQF
ncbi:plant/MNA5-17 protein, partial [Trifolium medium]|nr:plant/MNA5-17 protein [Trifolium medium]